MCQRTIKKVKKRIDDKEWSHGYLGRTFANSRTLVMDQIETTEADVDISPLVPRSGIT